MDELDACFDEHDFLKGMWTESKQRGCVQEDAGALREVQVYVGGMKCLACAARVKSHLLQSVEGAGSCEVELETGRVTVRGKGLSAESVIASAKGLGYEARLLRQPST